MNIYNLAFLWYIPIISGLLFQFSFSSSSPLPYSQQELKRDKVETANLVFKSIDGGQTWQDISQGLPEPVNDNYGVGRNVFFADDNGLWLTAGNGMYHNKPDSKLPFWTTAFFPDEHSSIAPGKAGIFAYNYSGGILQKTNGTSVWSPIFTNLQEKQIRSVFETAGGAVLIGSDNGLFKSTDSGKNWKQVHVGGWVIKLVESNGILVATSMSGIIRSTDDGETWAVVIKEGGVGIDVEQIKGGFAAITFSTASNTRRVRTSYDGGKTWQPIDAGLQAKVINESKWQPIIASIPAQGNVDSVWRPGGNNNLSPQAFITSIVQVGENFFCGHPAGIFKSSDKGKTWKLIFPSKEGKVFNLTVSGNVIYAIPRDVGC